LFEIIKKSDYMAGLIRSMKKSDNAQIALNEKEIRLFPDG